MRILILLLFALVFTSCAQTSTQYYVLEHFGYPKFRIQPVLILETEADSNCIHNHPDKALTYFVIDKQLFQQVAELAFSKPTHTSLNLDTLKGDWGAISFTMFNKKGEVQKSYISSKLESSITFLKYLIAGLPENKQSKKLLSTFNYYLKMFER